MTPAMGSCGQTGQTREDDEQWLLKDKSCLKISDLQIMNVIYVNVLQCSAVQKLAK
jgi:hypothetical protein